MSEKLPIKFIILLISNKTCQKETSSLGTMIVAILQSWLCFVVSGRGVETDCAWSAPAPAPAL